jgi:cyanophycinase-like exopeptidase
VKGVITFMGSGETGPSMVGIHRSILERTGGSRVTILDSSFGFQTNASELTEKIVEYFESSLRVGTEVASLRSPRASAFERARMIEAVNRAQVVFAGPGSPSYALRVWRGTGLAEALINLVQRGGAVVMASAAALTLGLRSIPVYEIYKAGADPHWIDGLDVLGGLGLRMVVVPHWNNQEGQTHDTSHCFIGTDRFNVLAADLEPDVDILGVDEHTGVTMDFERWSLEVAGVGGAVINDGRMAGSVALPAAGPRRPAPVSPLEPPGRELDERFSALLEAGRANEFDRLQSLLVDLGESIDAGKFGSPRLESDLVALVIELRNRARRSGDYAQADLIRKRLAEIGITVRDGAAGTTWGQADAPGSGPA